MTDAIDSLQRIITRRATEAEITAESGGALEEIRLAWATDTESLCIYTNGAWACISRTGSVSEPLILEDGTIAILENGHAAMSE